MALGFSSESLSSKKALKSCVRAAVVVAALLSSILR